MKKKLFLTGMLTTILAFGLVFIGCGDSEDEKTIDSKLIGKWEFEKIIMDGEEISLPYVAFGTPIITSGGYEFSSNSFTSYQDGRIVATAGMYTQNNTLYAQNGQAGYTYSISGNKLTAKYVDGSSGVIANKVTKFSWE